MAHDVFSGLANPIRRDILTELAAGPKSVTDLASRFEIGRPAVSEHLQVLRNIGLVQSEQVGQHRYYRLDAAPLAEAAQWLAGFEQYWKERLRDLRSVLDEENR
ncbi:metalloregulator ArsR/SmtB family transcription factor [Microbacterium sp. AZCO]|uniref:ArsR/SmtB family transcription factor n=1 Tax=Microbacterium sp. AZCO TaxID=3142976 RepID=UPI0031F41628